MRDSICEINEGRISLNSSSDVVNESKNGEEKELIAFTKTINKNKPCNEKDAGDYYNAHQILVELKVMWRIILEY